MVKVRSATRVSSSDSTRVKSNYMYIPHILRFYGKSNAARENSPTCWIFKKIKTYIEPQSDLPGLAPDYKPDHPRTSPPDSAGRFRFLCAVFGLAVTYLWTIQGVPMDYKHGSPRITPDRAGRPRCRYGLVPDCPGVDTDKLLAPWLIRAYPVLSVSYPGSPGVVRGSAGVTPALNRG